MRKITSVFCCHKKYFVTNQLPDLYCHLPILSKSCIYSHYFFAAIKKMIVYVTVQIFEIYLYFQFNLFQFNVKLDNCKISIILYVLNTLKVRKFKTFCNIVNVKLF